MKLHLLLAVGCMAASIQVQASNPLQPIELSDRELSQLRGRFVMPGHIVHFGVTMSSVWENASGQVLGGKVDMQLSEGMFRPQFNVSTITSRGDLDAPTAGAGQVTGGGGLSNVSGVSQSIRAAGDFNSAFNDVQMNVSKGKTAPASTQSGSSTLGKVVASSNAGSVQVDTFKGALQIAIDARGQGSSLQQLGGRGLQQHTIINGSGNTVRSLASLDLILRDNGMSLDQLKSGWNQLGALRPAGY